MNYVHNFISKISLVLFFSTYAIIFVRKIYIYIVITSKKLHTSCIVALISIKPFIIIETKYLIF